MFSLNGAVKYKYIPNYQDMRGGYDKLCGVPNVFSEVRQEHELCSLGV